MQPLASLRSLLTLPHLCFASGFIACSFLACSDAPPRAVTRPASELPNLLGPTSTWKQTLAAQGGKGVSAPKIQLRAHPLKTELISSETVTLDEDYAIQFVPLVRGLPKDGCEIALEAIDGGTRLNLWRGRPHFTLEPGADRGTLVAPLSRTARVSLRDLVGHSVHFRWSATEPCGDDGGWIANPRLHSRITDDEAPPSVLLVCSDQHRFDRTFGERGALLMPGLQAFAKDAVVYTHAYSNASWTLPSIVSTLTGLYPQYHRTGFRIASGRAAVARARPNLPAGQFIAGWGDDVHVLTAYPRRLVTLGERLQSRGYDTFAVVSNDFYALSGLASDGFDAVIDTYAARGEAVNRQALALLEQRRKNGVRKPLFLLVHYMDVHEYLRGHVNAARSALQRADLDPVQVRGWYDDAVRATDRNFTRLLAQWERTVGVGNSLVAFYSDHGEHLQEPNHRHDRHGDSMDEVLLHIPLAIRYPENQGIGARVDDRPVSLVDLVPTVLDVAGAAVGEEPLHGTSLAALARNASATDRAIFADFQLYGEELSSVRRGSRKLVLNTARGHQTLVDTGLAAELSAEHQARIDEPELESALVREYENYSERARNWSRGLVSDHEVDPQEALERLRAIGYVE